MNPFFFETFAEPKLFGFNNILSASAFVDHGSLLHLWLQMVPLQLKAGSSI
jgi:hypothetical protein